MQIIQITTLSGHSPYDITICNISYSNCSVVDTGVVSAPVTVTVPTALQSSSELIVLITDSIGCEYFEVISCVLPQPTPSITPTITPTSTNISCNCITFVNNNPDEYAYSYTDCTGFNYTYQIFPYTTIYVCGKDPIVYGPVTYFIGLPCIDNSCPIPSPTPSGTPTPTPTLPPIVGYFEDCCNTSNQFIVANIPFSYSPLSGTYFIQVAGFTGCVTSIGSFSSPNVYSYNLMSSSFGSCNDCYNSNPFYICPTPTPTVTPTNTQTPTPTPTSTLTPTPTPTICIPQTIYSGEKFSNLPVQNGASFNPDGTALFITLHNQSPSDGVCAYSLSTPWDVSTINLPLTGCSIASPVSPSANYGSYFSPDGTKLFLANDSSNCILRYTLSTAWDISTSSYSPGDLYSGATFTDPIYVEFSPDGYYMFVNLNFSTIKRYTLSTPWVINTGVVESQSISAPSTFGIRFQNNGYYLFSISTNTGVLRIVKRTLLTPYDLTSVVLTETSGSLSTFISTGNFFSLNFKDGYKGFIGVYYTTAPNNIFAFELNCEYNINGTVILPTPTPTPTNTVTPTTTPTNTVTPTQP